MIARLIAWSARNRVLVLIGTAFAVAAGVQALRTLPLDAIPDLSDVQTIVYTEYPGQAPQVVEDREENQAEEFDGSAVDSAFADEFVELDTEGGGSLVVREKFHYAKPMTIDQALLEMELVGHDFYLFRDKEQGLPSVVYRRKGFNYGVLRLME